MAVACGGRHTVVMTASRRALLWGDDTFGQCTGAGGADKHVTTPTYLPPAVGDVAPRVLGVAAAHWRTYVLVDAATPT